MKETMISNLRKTYLYQDLPASETGIGTQTVGQVDLTGSFVSGINSIGVAPGISTSIKTLQCFDSANFNGAFASVEITDRFETEPDHYIEAYIDFDEPILSLVSITLIQQLKHIAATQLES